MREEEPEKVVIRAPYSPPPDNKPKWHRMAALDAASRHLAGQNKEGAYSEPRDVIAVAEYYLGWLEQP